MVLFYWIDKIRVFSDMSFWANMFCFHPKQLVVHDASKTNWTIAHDFMIQNINWNYHSSVVTLFWRYEASNVCWQYIWVVWLPWCLWRVPWLVNLCKWKSSLGLHCACDLRPFQKFLDPCNLFMVDIGPHELWRGSRLGYYLQFQRAGSWFQRSLLLVLFWGNNSRRLGHCILQTPYLIRNPFELLPL